MDELLRQRELSGFFSNSAKRFGLVRIDESGILGRSAARRETEQQTARYETLSADRPRIPDSSMRTKPKTFG